MSVQRGRRQNRFSCVRNWWEEVPVEENGAGAGVGRASLGRDAGLTPVKGQREERGLRAPF